MKLEKTNQKYFFRQERPYGMKKLFLFVLALSVSALSVSAAESSLEERVDGIQAQVDRALAKAGIHFSGEFRSQFLGSTVDGEALGLGKSHESVEYTSVDFDITARPNTALSARAMFRLHQDWRIFFSDVQNPITTRWLSIDGSLLSGILKYNVGDYQKKLTPLTLWSPDLEFLFEPEIFAENRRQAMADAFVGDNNRALQGGNISFEAELYPLLHNLKADVFGARLAARGTGESGVVAPGVGGAPNGEYWDNEYDRYLLGFNLETQIIKGAGVGISDILIYDHISSYKNKGSFPSAADTAAARLNAQSTNVIAGRFNVDNRVFMDDDFINVGVNFEAAMSADKKPYMENAEVIDSSNTGIAVNFDVAARVALGEDNTIKLSLGYIMNDSSFRNDAAQSPSFVQRQIMNNENGLSGLGLMNPFDAVYRHVFKYAPSQYFGGPKPFTKNAYFNGIMTRENSEALKGTNGLKYPSVFQAALPGGTATADRVGPLVGLSGGFLDNAVNVGAKIAMLNSKEEYSGEKWKYDEMVGGASVDVAKFVPVVGQSLVVGFSGGMYNSEHLGWANKNTLGSFGIDYNFFQRFSFLMGYQMLLTDLPEETFVIDAMTTETGKYDYTFTNLAFGLAYRVADGGHVTFKLGILSGEMKSDNVLISKVDELDGTTIESRAAVTRDYSAFQPEVFLTVKF